MFPSSLLFLLGSMAIFVIDFRPITLRRQVSLVLPFGQPAGPTSVIGFRCLALRRRLSTVLLFSIVWRS